MWIFSPLNAYNCNCFLEIMGYAIFDFASPMVKLFCCFVSIELLQRNYVYIYIVKGQNKLKFVDIILLFVNVQSFMKQATCIAITTIKQKQQQKNTTTTPKYAHTLPPQISYQIYKRINYKK